MGDIMLFGVLEMPESMWENDSPLDRAQRRSRYVQAAQRIRDQDEQLAAKDREIAELRARPTMELLSELMRGLELPPDCLTLKPAAMYSIGLAIADQAKRCIVAESARDEARECVGRLYSAIADALGVLGSGNCQACQCAGCEHERAEVKPTLRAALAATPEHLRK